MPAMEGSANTQQMGVPASRRRESHLAGNSKSFHRLKLGKFDFAEEGIEKNVLLETLIVECLLNNPDIRIFEESVSSINILQLSDPKDDIPNIKLTDAAEVHQRETDEPPIRWWSASGWLSEQIRALKMFLTCVVSSALKLLRFCPDTYFSPPLTPVEGDVFTLTVTHSWSTEAVTKESKTWCEVKNVNEFACHHNPMKGDIFTLLNVMRSWSTKAATKESKIWCQVNNVKEFVCHAVENYVEGRFAHVKDTNGEVLNLHFTTNTEETDEILYDIVIKELEENVCIFRGHPSLGYLSLQSYKNVHLDFSSVAHCYKMYPSRILTLTDPLESSSPSKTLCMVISEGKASEIYKRLSMGDNLEHTIEENSVIPIRVPDIGETVVEQMRKSWEIRAETVPSSLKSFVEALCPHSPVIFEDNGNDFTLYALPKYNKRINEAVHEELNALKSRLKTQVAEICYPSKKSSMRVLLEAGGIVREILYPDQFRCLAIIQTCEAPLSKEKVLSELKKFGKVDSITQYHGGKLALRKWGKVTFKNSADVEKVLQANLSGSFLLEFAFAIDVEYHLKTFPRVTIDKSQTVSVRICRRPCESGKVKVKISGKRNYGKLLNTTLKVGKTTSAVGPYGKCSDVVLVSGCDPLVTEEDITNAFDTEHGFQPEHVEIDRLSPFHADNNELEFFKCSLTRMIDKVKVNIKVIEPKPDDVFIYAQLKFRTPRIAKSASDNIKNKKIKGMPLQVLDHVDDFHSLRMTVPDDIHLALENELHTEVNKLLLPGNFILNIQDISPHGKLYTFSPIAISLFDRIVQLLRSVTRPTIHSLSQEEYKKITSKRGSVFLKYLRSTCPCSLHLDRRTGNIAMYAPKESLKQLKEQLKEFFSHSDIYRRFDFSDRHAKDNAMFDFANDRIANIQNVEILPVTSGTKDLYVKGSKEAINNLDAKYFAQDELLECGVCYSPIQHTDEHKAYILASCQHSYCMECLTGLVEETLQSRSFPINCTTCDEAMCLRDVFKVAGRMKSDCKAVAKKSIDNFIGSNVKEWAYCHNVKCSGILRKTPNRQYYLCPICDARQCPKCGVDYHSESSCEDQNQIAFEKWMKEGNNRKICPNCKMAIEKVSGCNRVHCSFCHQEICWVCLQHYPDSNAAYNHLNAEHGGYC